MRKVFKWVSENKLIITLTLITVAVLGFPLFVHGVLGAFYYQQDPDIVYIGNALLYIKNAAITYIDHPGTPAIMLLSVLYFPLRFYLKYFVHTGFLEWSFNNFDFLVYYSRILQVTIYGISLLIFLKVIKNVAKSDALVLFAWLAFLTIRGNLDQALSISAENLSFLFASLWLVIFIQFRKNQSFLRNLLLVIIAGIATANKFTNLFLLIPSLLFPLLKMKKYFLKSVANVILNTAVAVLSFGVAIWPSLNRLNALRRWVFILFKYDGVYGSGSKAIFNPAAYYSSVFSLIKSDPVIYIIIFMTVIGAIFILVKKKIKVTDPVVFLLLSAMLGIAAYSKYPISRYNFTNFVLIIFCSAVIIKIFGRITINLMLPIFLIVMIFNSMGYIKASNCSMDKNMNFQKYLWEHPAEINILWGFQNKYYILHDWTSFWASDVYGEEFSAKPVLMLTDNMKDVKVYSNSYTPEIKSVLGTCWDVAYLTASESGTFAKLNKNVRLTMFKVPGETDIYRFESDFCKNKL